MTRGSLRPIAPHPDLQARLLPGNTPALLTTAAAAMAAASSRNPWGRGCPPAESRDYSNSDAIASAVALADAPTRHESI
jgi:hypothetical protein